MHLLTGGLLSLLGKYSLLKDTCDAVGQLSYIDHFDDLLNGQIPNTELSLKMQCRGTYRKVVFLSCRAHTRSLRDYNRRG